MKVISWRINYCKHLVILLLTGLFCCQLSAEALSQKDEKLLSIIEEAADYSLVKPSHALTILEANSALLKGASEYYKYRYFAIAFWSSASLYDAKRASYFIEKMLETRDFDNSERLFSGLMSSLSVWYRGNQDYQSAIDAAHCAIRFAESEVSLNNSLLPLGLTYFMTDKYDDAINIFKTTVTLSAKYRHVQIQSAALNNLGIVQVFTRDYKKAESHFRAALKINEKLARANGTAVNLANLVLVFYLQGDWQSVYRVLSRTSRAIQSLHNSDLEHYLFWLTSAFKIKAESNQEINAHKLVESYQQVKEPAVLKLIELIADDMKITLPTPVSSRQGRNLNFATTFPTCLTEDNKELVSDKLKAATANIEKTAK